MFDQPAFQPDVTFKAGIWSSCEAWGIKNVLVNVVTRNLIQMTKNNERWRQEGIWSILYYIKCLKYDDCSDNL
jgi:hypothetical protein